MRSGLKCNIHLSSEFFSKTSVFALSSLELFFRDDLAPIKAYDQEMLVRKTGQPTESQEYGSKYLSLPYLYTIDLNVINP